MKKQFRILNSAFLILLVMVCMLGMFSLTASAAEGTVASVTVGGVTTLYDTLDEAFTMAQAHEGSTLTLLDTITNAPATYINSGKFTIDLNGQTFESASRAFIIYNADVTITDLSADGKGKVISKKATTIMLGNGAKLEIAGGTFEATNGFWILDTADNGRTSTAQVVFSDGKMITEGWSAINVDCSSVTVLGGEIVSIGDDIQYTSGVLDYSRHPDPTGWAFCPSLWKIRIFDAIRIKLPAGYCIYEQSGNTVSALVDGYTYVVGKTPADTGSFCTCKTKCSHSGVTGSCPVCCSDLSVCVGVETQPADNITLYYRNTYNWTQVYAYYWGGNTIAPWPGVAMTNEGDGLWSVTVPADAVNIDFNDGYDKRSTLTVPTDGKNYYNAGTWEINCNNHTGGVVTYAPTKDGAQHVAIWSCCGVIGERDDHTFENDYACAVCNAPALSIYGQQLNLGGDLSMKYYVAAYAPEFDPSRLAMEFLHNGVKTVVYAGEPNADGFYVFTLEGVGPQCMGDNIYAKLYCGGNEVAKHGYDEKYSVEINLKNLLEEYKDDAALVALIKDTLAYGEAASAYKKHQTMTGNTYTENSSKREIPVIEADRFEIEPNSPLVEQYTVRFGTTLSIKIKVSYLPLTRVYVNGKEYVTTEEDVKRGYIIFESDPISATDFDKDFSVIIQNDEGENYSYIHVSVNDYLYAISQSADASDTMKALAKALYNYGVSAKEYAASLNN